jgi:hypothetical protein
MCCAGIIVRACACCAIVCTCAWMCVCAFLFVIFLIFFLDFVWSVHVRVWQVCVCTCCFVLLNLCTCKNNNKKKNMLVLFRRSRIAKHCAMQRTVFTSACMHDYPLNTHTRTASIKAMRVSVLQY